MKVLLETSNGITLKYCRKLNRAEVINQLVHGTRGKPVKLGVLDEQVQNYIRKLRMCGGIVDRTVGALMV